VLCLDLNHYWIYNVERQSDYLKDKEGSRVSEIQTSAWHPHPTPIKKSTLVTLGMNWNYNTFMKRQF
jgi:hypothetical protein